MKNKFEDEESDDETFKKKDKVSVVASPVVKTESPTKKPGLSKS